MNQNTLRNIKKYDRVMPRVYNRSRSSLKANSLVMRHDTPSSVHLSGKPSVSNVNSSSNDLPIVLNDYNPECEKPVKRTFVVKPRRTLKSLDPALSPPRPERCAQDLSKKPRNLRVGTSESSVLPRVREKWSDSHLKQCFSSRSHSKLKDLKEEIQAYHETEKLMKLRSNLYKSCGVVLDDVGKPAADKAVQVEVTGHEKHHEDINITKSVDTKSNADGHHKTIHNASTAHQTDATLPQLPTPGKRLQAGAPASRLQGIAVT